MCGAKIRTSFHTVSTLAHFFASPTQFACGFSQKKGGDISEIRPKALTLHSISTTHTNKKPHQHGIQTYTLPRKSAPLHTQLLAAHCTMHGYGHSTDILQWCRKPAILSVAIRPAYSSIIGRRWRISTLSHRPLAPKHAERGRRVGRGCFQHFRCGVCAILFAHIFPFFPHYSQRLGTHLRLCQRLG